MVELAVGGSVRFLWENEEMYHIWSVVVGSSVSTNWRERGREGGVSEGGREGGGSE